MVVRVHLAVVFHAIFENQTRATCAGFPVLHLERHADAAETNPSPSCGSAAFAHQEPLHRGIRDAADLSRSVRWKNQSALRGMIFS